MTYSEIVDYPRGWDRARFPVLAHLEIEPEQFSELERMIADQTLVRVLGHDEAGGGRIVVHVGCADEAAQRRLVRRWV